MRQLLTKLGNKSDVLCSENIVASILAIFIAFTPHFSVASEEMAYYHLQKYQEAICKAAPSERCIATDKQLEETLREAWKGMGGQSSFNIDEKILDEIIKQIKEESNNLLKTEYELGIYTIILHDLYNQVRDAAESIGMAIEHKPALGTLAHGQISATTLPVPSSNHKIIAFDRDFFQLSNEMSKNLVDALPRKRVNGVNRLYFQFNKEEFEQNLRDQPDVFSYFIDLTVEFVGIGKVRHRFGTTLSGIEDAMTDGVNLFVMAHEIAHVLKGHGAAVVPLATQSSVGAVETGASVSDWAWRQEIEADLLAITLLYNVVSRNIEEKKQYAEILLSGPVLFFAMYEMIETVATAIGYGDTRCLRHTQEEAARYKALVADDQKKESAELLDRFAETYRSKRSHPPVKLRLATAVSQLDIVSGDSKATIIKDFTEGMMSRIQHLGEMMSSNILKNRESLISTLDDGALVKTRSYAPWCNS